MKDKKKEEDIMLLKASESTTMNHGSFESKPAKKASQKREQRIDKAALAASSERFHLTRPPEKSTRGRKAVDIDEYIARSTEQIATWQEQLIEMRQTMSKKDCDTLYNKITAL